MAILSLYINSNRIIYCIIDIFNNNSYIIEWNIILLINKNPKISFFENIEILFKNKLLNIISNNNISIILSNSINKLGKNHLTKIYNVVNKLVNNLNYYIFNYDLFEIINYYIRSSINDNIVELSKLICQNLLFSCSNYKSFLDFYEKKTKKFSLAVCFLAAYHIINL